MGELHLEVYVERIRREYKVPTLSLSHIMFDELMMSGIMILWSFKLSPFIAVLF